MLINHSDMTERKGNKAIIFKEKINRFVHTQNNSVKLLTFNS